MFSNGLSSSAADTADWPTVVTYADLVEVQRRLLAEVFGVERLAAVYGFSMGAQQAYHWAALHPDRVARAFVVCGTARTSVHNRVFHSGLLRTLEAAPEHLGDGKFSAEPLLAKKAFAHIYAGLGRSVRTSTVPTCTKVRWVHPTWRPTFAPIGRIAWAHGQRPTSMRSS